MTAAVTALVLLFAATISERVGLPSTSWLSPSEAARPSVNQPVRDERHRTFGSWTASCTLDRSSPATSCTVAQPFTRGGSVRAKLYTADEGRSFQILSGPLPIASEVRLGRQPAFGIACTTHCAYGGAHAIHLDRHLQDGRSLSYVVTTHAGAAEVEVSGSGYLDAIATVRSWRQMASAGMP